MPPAYCVNCDGSKFSKPVALNSPRRPHNYRQLRQRGRTVRKTIDCLIATFCLRDAHALLHADRDFDAFEELLHMQVVHP